jgi:hypothetical protein
MKRISSGPAVPVTPPKAALRTPVRLFRTGIAASRSRSRVTSEDWR